MNNNVNFFFHLLNYIFTKKKKPERCRILRRDYQNDHLIIGVTLNVEVISNSL